MSSRNSLSLQEIENSMIFSQLLEIAKANPGVPEDEERSWMMFCTDVPLKKLEHGKEPLDFKQASGEICREKDFIFKGFVPNDMLNAYNRYITAQNPTGQKMTFTYFSQKERNTIINDTISSPNERLDINKNATIPLNDKLQRLKNSLQHLNNRLFSGDNITYALNILSELGMVNEDNIRSIHDSLLKMGFDFEEFDKWVDENPEILTNILGLVMVATGFSMVIGSMAYEIKHRTITLITKDLFWEGEAILLGGSTLLCWLSFFNPFEDIAL